MFRLGTSHRGWAFITGQRLWSGETFNFQTMQRESGLMYTLGKLIKNISKTLSEDGIKNIGKAIRTAKDNLNDHEKINFFRMMVYMATFMMTIIAMMALYSIDGDDDDDDDMGGGRSKKGGWLTQFSLAVAFRTINEILSQMPFFFFLNVIDMLSDPFVMMRKLKDLTDIRNWDPFSTVQSGTYKGESYAFRLLAKQTFIKQWYNVKTAEDVKRTHDWWKQNNRRSLMIFDAMFGRKEENDD